MHGGASDDPVQTKTETRRPSKTSAATTAAELRDLPERPWVVRASAASAGCGRMKSMSDPRHDPKHLLDIIDQQNQMIEKLLAENDEFRANGQKLDALTCLKAVYSNPKASEGNRIKAAAAAIPFERSKLTVNLRVGPAILGERLDSARTIDVTPEQQALPAA